MFAPVKFTISAPGKVILFGEHSVVYGKPALAAAINKRTSLIFETVPSDSIKIEFPSLNWKIELSVSEISSFECVHGSSDGDNVKNLIEQAANDVTNLKNSENFSVSQNKSLQCVFFLLRGLFSKQKILNGFKIVISTELVLGAGTGSSASFSVCLTAALYQLHRISQADGARNSQDLGHFSSKELVPHPLHEKNGSPNNVDKTQMAEKCGFLNTNTISYTILSCPGDRLFKLDKEIINEWAFACEQIIHGKASGLDNFVCTYGSVVEMHPSDKDQGKKFETLPEPPKLRILLVNTGVSRNTSVLVKKVAELRSNNPKIVNLVLDAMEEIVNEARIILRHLSTNKEPVVMLENEKSFSRLEDLVLLNQGLLSSIGVSHESLDNVINITKKFGLRSKLTGAGGGGYAITLVPPSASKNDIQDCEKTLQENGYKTEDIIIGDRGVDIKMN